MTSSFMAQIVVHEINQSVQTMYSSLNMVNLVVV